MPVPSTIADLSTTAGSNSPAGTEAPSTLDNYQRAHASFIAQLRAVIGGATDANIPTSWPTESDLSDAVISQSGNSGTTAGTSTAYTLTPANALASYAANSTFWVKFHTASGDAPTIQISGLATPPNLVRQDESGAYVNIASGNIPANHYSRVTLISATQALVEDMPPVFGNTLDTVRIDVASSATVNLTSLAPDTRHINITGTTGITGFTVAAGRTYFVRFNAALTLTNSAGLVTQRGADITTAAGDTCIIRATAANVVELICYKPVVSESVGVDQTWQNVTGSRVLGTTYTNSTGRPIMVAVTTDTPSGNVDLAGYVQGAEVARQQLATGGAILSTACITLIVPDGDTYKFVCSDSLEIWSELR